MFHVKIKIFKLPRTCGINETIQFESWLDDLCDINHALNK